MDKKITAGERAILQSLATLAKVIVKATQAQMSTDKGHRDMLLSVAWNHIHFMDEIFESAFEEDDNA